MARKCCVKNCDSTIGRSNDKKLYKLPGDIKLRTKWLKNCGIVDNSSSDGPPTSSYSTQSTPGLYVCGRHFRNNDYEPVAGQRGLSLKKDAVPTVFQDYGKNSDAVKMPVKSLDYPQEDLDLINSKTLTRRASAALLDSPNDSSGEACNSRPHSSADSLNPFESQEENENGEVLGIHKDKPKKAETKETPPAEPPPGIRPLDVLSEVQNQASLENVQRVVSRGDLNFFPGAKLEAKDFNDQWYAARVVEIDWADGEALIHFEKWSARFDEWIPMDSPRLRELRSVQPRDPRAKDFEVGERVLATWADGRKYPAKVNAVMGNDRYDVLFDDGYSKVVRSSKMTKIAGTSEKPANNQQQSPQMDPEPYIGSKQERRDRKRKHTVTELFHVRKRARGDDKSSKKDEMPEDQEQEAAASETASASLETEPLRGFPAATKKTKNQQRRKREYPKADEDDDEYGPEWIDGEPQGIESLTSDGTRRSIIVSDRRLPPGWQKHFVQRKTGSSAGKWDVVFVHELTEKKFRSRSDLKSFFEAQGQPNFNTDVFDFCIHRRKKSGARNQAVKSENSVDPPKKIKTLLPKAKASPTPPQPAQENLVSTPVSSPFVPASTPATPGDDSAVFIGGLRVEMEDSAYKCPIEGCSKTFRKENLLQMHIKHYHKEYSQFVGSTPNVADLAYARTIGESIQDLAPKKSTDKRKSLQNSHTMSPLAAPEISITEHDSKLELMSPVSAHSQDVSDDGGSHRVDPGAMSPGALFDLKLKEEKTPVGGIKTLLPLRPASDRSKSVDESGHFEKVRGQRKRQLSEYSTDSGKGRKSKGPHDISEEYGDLDDSALDAEGPAGLVYRYSRRKSDAKSDDNSQSNGEGMMMLINGELVKVEQLKREEIINCACAITEEDGLMIQCDLCLCWQHGHCHGIEREADVPEKYVCSICRNPFRGRESNRYVHNQDWIKEGKLETMTTRDQEILNQQTALLKRSFELVAALNAIRDILHSLRVKINVAQKKDHPKLYLWAKHWEKMDIPAPQLEPVPIMKIIDPKAEESLEDTKIKTEDEEETRDDVLEAKHRLMEILEDSSVINGDKEENSQLLMGALMKDDEEEVKKENKEEETAVPLEEPVKTMQPIIPEPEAPIDLEECRSRLLDHIMHYQAHVDSRLDTVEAQIEALEETMDSNKPPSQEITARFKQTVQMLNRDLITMRKLAVFDEERREQEQQQQQLQQQQVS